MAGQTFASIPSRLNGDDIDATWFNILKNAGLTIELSNIANVKNYGALGDGTTDDTSAINAAISSGAGVVYFPDGTYVISAPLVLVTFSSFSCVSFAAI